jgi:LmbE family N-acetylglucosaminyl deacetylase
MPEDWQRALAVVAHPDDLEYGTSAAVARWTGEGRAVTYLLATRGEAGIDGMDPEQAAVVREREQIEAATIVGVSDVEFLDHADGVIEYGLRLRRDIAAAIRRSRPELVLTLNHRDWPGGYPNTPDHRHVGQAVVDAVGDAGNRWVFRDLAEQPWGGVRWVGVAGSPLATHAAEISPEALDLGVASLRAHRAYLEGLGEGPMSDVDTFLRRSAESTAERFGGRLGVPFELITF